MKFLSDLGVQTCQDVRTVWRNGQLLVEEFETDHGRLPADQAFSIAMMHTLACRRGQDALRRGVGELVDERTSTERGRPVITLSGVPEPAHPPRQVIREGFTGGPPVLVELAARDPHAREVATKQAKLDAMFQLMMEDFVDPEEIGLSPEELTDPLKFQQFKDSLLVAPTRLGVQRLSTLVSSLRRWKRWALELPCSVRSPTPFNVAMFLRQVSRGGPTAAASMWHVMAWYATKMGLQFPTTPMVHPFRMHELTHSGVQACELAPWELVNLVMMASHAQGSYRLVLAFMIQSAVSCIRYEHMQRSSLVRCGPDYLEFRCSQGKARRQGARPAYSWVTPEVSWQGWSLISTLRDFYTNELLPNCGFLWPALRLTSEDLWEITDMTPFAVNRAMSRPRFSGTSSWSAAGNEGGAECCPDCWLQSLAAFSPNPWECAGPRPRFYAGCRFMGGNPSWGWATTFEGIQSFQPNEPSLQWPEDVAVRPSEERPHVSHQETGVGVVCEQPAPH